MAAAADLAVVVLHDARGTALIPLLGGGLLGFLFLFLGGCLLGGLFRRGGASLPDGGALALSLGGDHQEVVLGFGHCHGDHAGRGAIGPGLQEDAPDAGGGGAHLPHLAHMEADGASCVGGEEDLALAGGHLGVDEVVALLPEIQGPFACLGDMAEDFHAHAFHHAIPGDHHHGFARQGGGIGFIHGEDGPDLLLGLLGVFTVDEGEDIVDEAPGVPPAALRQFVGASEAVDPAEVGEEEKGVVASGGKHHLDGVPLLPGLHAPHPAAAPVLGRVLLLAAPLDVAQFGEGDYVDFPLGEPVQVQFALVPLDAGAAGIGELRLGLQQFLLHHRHDLLPAGKDFLAGLDGGLEFPMLPVQVVHRKIGQLGQPHVQDGVGLEVVQGEALHQLALGVLPVLGAPDDPDHLVDVGLGNEQPRHDVVPLLGLPEDVPGAADNDLLSMVHVGLQQLLQRHGAGAVVVHHQELGGIGDFQGGVAEELVEDHVGHRILLQGNLHHHAVAVAGVVVDAADAGDDAGLGLLANLGHHVRLVDAIGDFRHPDEKAARPLHGDHLSLAPQSDAALPGGVELAHALQAVDDAAGGEIRPRQDLHEFLQGDVGIVDEGHRRVDGLPQVVGGHVGGHAHADSLGPVHQEIGEGGRQDNWLHLLPVEGLPHVHGLLVQIRQEGLSRLVHLAFGIPVGGRPVPIHGAEISVSHNQRDAHGEVLGHANDGFVDGGISVGMVVADDFTYHLGALVQAAGAGEAPAEHGIEDAAGAGLQSVPYIGDGAAHVGGDGVLEVGSPHDGVHLCGDVVALDGAPGFRRNGLGLFFCHGDWVP